MDICVCVCLLPNSSKMTNPSNLKSSGMIALAIGEVLSKKKIWICQTVSLKIACILAQH